MATKTETQKPERAGVLPSVAFLALDIADRGQSTVIALLQDARLELRTAADHGIDAAEKLAGGAFRFVRKLNQRVDDAAAEALTGVERVVGGVIKGAREATQAAQLLATTTGSAVAGRAGQQAAA